jgi:hypothetical protein
VRAITEGENTRILIGSELGKNCVETGANGVANGGRPLPFRVGNGVANGGFYPVYDVANGDRFCSAPPRSPPHHPPTNTKNPTQGVRIFVISTVQCLYVGVSNNATFEIEMLELVKGKAHKEGWFDKKEFAALDLDEHTLEEHLHGVFVSSAKSRRAQDKVAANGGAEAAKVNYKRCSPYVRVCVCMYC